MFDLSLLGRPLAGHVYARKAGHALHIEFARALDAALLDPAARTSGRQERPGSLRKAEIGRETPAGAVEARRQLLRL